MKCVNVRFKKLRDTGLKRLQSVNINKMSEYYMLGEEMVLALSWKHCPTIRIVSAAYCILGFGSIVSTLRLYKNLKQCSLYLEHEVKHTNYIVHLLSDILTITHLKLRILFHDFDDFSFLISLH
eukprot:TRINITY_DN2767_c0_g1_i1.p2 TRINITY_DN2767_c0_g1~~TRINITY_DN2767_c0_g1_i1.p2  ORF type:complete len:124 (+),score=6.84 TRINITY_DN2767_c0_g1_i1:408-779(+)